MGSSGKFSQPTRIPGKNYFKVRQERLRDLETLFTQLINLWPELNININISGRGGHQERRQWEGDGTEGEESSHDRAAHGDSRVIPEVISKDNSKVD